MVCASSEVTEEVEGGCYLKREADVVLLSVRGLCSANTGGDAGGLALAQCWVVAPGRPLDEFLDAFSTIDGMSLH